MFPAGFFCFLTALRVIHGLRKLHIPLQNTTRFTSSSKEEWHCHKPFLTNCNHCPWMKSTQNTLLRFLELQWEKWINPETTPPDYFRKLVWNQVVDFERQIANWCIVETHSVYEIENKLYLVCEAVIAKPVMKVTHFTYFWSWAIWKKRRERKSLSTFLNWIVMLKPFEWRGWEVTLVKHKTKVICPIKTKQMAQEANQNAKKTCTQRKAREKTRNPGHGWICFCTWLVKNRSVSSDWAEQIMQILVALGAMLNWLDLWKFIPSAINCRRQSYFL